MPSVLDARAARRLRDTLFAQPTVRAFVQRALEVLDQRVRDAALHGAHHHQPDEGLFSNVWINIHDVEPGLESGAEYSAAADLLVKELKRRGFKSAGMHGHNLCFSF